MESKRNFLFDNIKGILIFLVVFGHFIEPFTSTSKWIFMIYAVIYSFHMATFFYISGYFSKNVDKSRDKAFEKLLFQYLIVSILAFIDQYLRYGKGALELFAPEGITWFFIALFYFRFFLKDLVKIKYILPITFLAALVVGFIDNVGVYMSLSRTFVYLPFFLLGFFTSEKHINKIRNMNKAIPALLGISLLFITAYLFVERNLSGRVVTMKTGYDSYNLDPWDGMLARLFVMVVAVSMILLLISLSSEKKSILSTFGMNSLTVYVGHIVFLRTFRDYNPFAGMTIETVILAFLSAIVTVYILSLQSVSRFWDTFLSKLYGLIMKK